VEHEERLSTDRFRIKFRNIAGDEMVWESDSFTDRSVPDPNPVVRTGKTRKNPRR